ncbi:SHOCT domain-containing protein [Aromatoleum toluclasticum]|uniref:SHOCT domain-containing protein n=1 Tax=Aromatoleum toluclasticum TaxID=92003 RepID=UPI000A04D6AC|nr:SHOCT domain-containing protein [Aromatoleum toluclasticum]
MLFDTFDRTGNAEFPFPKQVVFHAVCAAVEGLKGMEIDNRDELASRVDVKTGMSAFSWGEKVSISVTGNGGSGATISVQSAAKTIFGSATTHGKNRENVREIIRRTSELLAQDGSRWQEEMGLIADPMLSASSAQSVQSVADEITKLAALRDQGILTPDEFNSQKARLLGS